MKANAILSSAKEVNALRYNLTKVYTENGETFRINVKIQLTDECKNGVCSWSVTADIDRNGRYYEYSGGCCHKEILKHFPEFKKFVSLHLCDCYGAPLYAVENGFYHIKNSSKETAIDYLRITENEYNALFAAEDKQYFKYLLYTLGIVRRWDEEAKEAIKELEALTGCKWVNPYEYEEEKRNIKMFTDEEAAEMNRRLDSGYYEPEAIQARKEEAVRKAYEKKRAEIIKRCSDKVKKEENERDVLLYILDSGLSVDNVIYYPHTNKVVFNWKEYSEKVSQEDFIDFVNKADYSKLPDGVQFEIK